MSGKLTLTLRTLSRRRREFDDGAGLPRSARPWPSSACRARRAGLCGAGGARDQAGRDCSTSASTRTRSEPRRARCERSSWWMPSVYPDSRCLRLRGGLAAAHEVRADEVLVGNGSVELIWLLAAGVSRARRHGR